MTVTPPPVPDASTPEPEFELPPPIALRRAVVRGNARVALITAVLLATAFLGARAGLTAYTGQASRMAHFEDVVGYGWSVAHPGFSAGVPDEVADELRGADQVTHSATRASLLPSSRQITATGFGGPRPPWITQNFWGHVQSPAIEPGFRLIDPLQMARLAVGQHRTTEAERKKRQRAFALALPEQANVAAVVEFSHPLGIDEWNTFRRLLLTDAASAFRIEANLSILLSDARPSNNADLGEPLAWPTPDLRGFQRWAERLRPSDQRNLNALGLPSLSMIERSAEAGVVHGFVVGGLPRAILLRLLDSQAVTSAQVGDVALAAAPPE